MKPQEITEQDEEEDRPEKRHEPVGVFLQHRPEHLRAQELQIASKKFRAPLGASTLARLKTVGKIISISSAATSAISIWLVTMTGPTLNRSCGRMCDVASAAARRLIMGRVSLLRLGTADNIRPVYLPPGSWPARAEDRIATIMAPATTASADQ